MARVYLTSFIEPFRVSGDKKRSSNVRQRVLRLLPGATWNLLWVPYGTRKIQGPKNDFWHPIESKKRLQMSKLSHKMNVSAKVHLLVRDNPKKIPLEVIIAGAALALMLVLGIVITVFRCRRKNNKKMFRESFSMTMHSVKAEDIVTQATSEKNNALKPISAPTAVHEGKSHEKNKRLSRAIPESSAFKKYTDTEDHRMSVASIVCINETMPNAGDPKRESFISEFGFDKYAMRKFSAPLSADLSEFGSDV